MLEALLYSNPMLTLGLPYLLKSYICPASGLSPAFTLHPHGMHLSHVLQTLCSRCCRYNAWQLQIKYSAR